MEVVANCLQLLKGMDRSLERHPVVFLAMAFDRAKLMHFHPQEGSSAMVADFSRLMALMALNHPALAAMYFGCVFGCDFEQSCHCLDLPSSSKSRWWPTCSCIVA